MFDELSQGVREIAFLSDPTMGEVRIGCPESIAAALLTAIVERFSLQYPRVVIHIVQLHDISPEFRELRERNVDLVLARIPTPFAADDLKAETLLNDSLFVVAGTQSPWARRRKLLLAELIDEPWVLPPLNTMFGSRVIETFRAMGLDLPRASVVSLSMHLRNNLLATGRFVSFESASALSFSGQRFSLKALPIDLPVRVGAIALVTLKNRTVSPLANLFIESARTVAKQIQKVR